MSWIPGNDPCAGEDPCPEAVERVIVPRTADIGGFEVRRVLPFRERRMVGPFIFWDEMGPGEFLTGDGIDVLPHPHIGLATVTFLERGSLEHRDSLGSATTIEPGDVNLMTAGAGIVHSERTGAEVRARPSSLAGIQCWLALPRDVENSSPTFERVAKERLPTIDDGGLHARVILGEVFGARSPVTTHSPTVYADVRMDAGASWEVPKEIEERAFYILEGELSVDGLDVPAHRLLVLKPGFAATVRARSACRWMLLGGDAMDGPRHIWWNFVASSKDAIEAAKERWRAGEFPMVPGDDGERTPLPA